MTTTAHGRSPRRDVVLACIGTAMLLLVVTMPLGPRALVAGVAAAGALATIALLETRTAVVTWPTALATLMLIVWLVPIKGYALPVDLPFNLEHYRLAILALGLALALEAVMGRRRIRFGSRALPVLLLCGGAVGAMLANETTINAVNLDSGAAIKSLSYFLSFFLVFVLVCSVLDTHEAIDTVIRMIVGGAVVVALAALYESRTRYNIFDHLHEWLPGFERQLRDVSLVRGGLVRVLASSQHPIALTTALVLVMPLALYLTTRARTTARSWGWTVALVVIATGAAATVSRTLIVMVLVMTVVAVWLRPALIRLWPVLLILPVVIHFAAPGAIGGIYKAFFPQEGLVASLNDRAGEGGSGRFADLGPAVRLWEQKPVVGHGLGNEFPSTDASMSPGQDPLPVIYDNQYVDTMVKLGVVGLIGAVWFFWGGAIGLLRAARRATGPPSDLLAACAVAVFGFAASMFVFDAFAFVQATLICVVVIALGYRLVELSDGVVPTEGAQS